MVTRKGKVAVMTAFGQPLDIREFELPKVEPGAVLLKTEISGICGTDVHQWRGGGGAPPLIPGHEVIGKIYEMGRDVEEDATGNQIDVGDRVLLNFAKVCGKCNFCLRGELTLCSNRTFIQRYRPLGTPPYFLGGYAEFVYVPPGGEFLKIPETLSSEIVSVFACAGPTMTHGFESVPIGVGESVVVQGSGPMGLFGVLYARQSGASKIVNVGAPTRRLEMAEKLGADYTVDIAKVASKEERVERVRELTDDVGADVILECTGVPSAVQEGMDTTRDGGRYLVIGCYIDKGPVPINPHNITYRELKLYGSNGYAITHMYKYLNFIGSVKDKYPITDLLTHKFSLMDATEALEKVEKAESIKAIFTF